MVFHKKARFFFRSFVIHSNGDQFAQNFYHM